MMRHGRVSTNSVLVIVLATLTLGCAVRVQQLKMEPLVHDKSISAADQTDKHFLLYPLEDLRGPNYRRAYPTSYIPVVHFFHAGSRDYYVDSSGSLVSYHGGRSTVTVGALPDAFPHLLANMMRDMRFTPNAVPIDQVNTKTDVSKFDYIVTGKLVKTTIKNHMNFFPLAILAILGVPYQFVNYELEYEVTLSRVGQLDQPMMTKTYTFAGTKVVGFYYGFSVYATLFVDGLEATLPDVVSDLAAAAR